MHEVLVNRLGGLSMPRKSGVRLTDRPDMTFDVCHVNKTKTTQQKQQLIQSQRVTDLPTVYNINNETQRVRVMGLISYLQ